MNNKELLEQLREIEPGNWQKVYEISPDYACHRLFGPALLARLDPLDAHPSLRHAIQLATELEDVADIIPDKLAQSIAEVEAELLKALTALAPAGLAGEKWLVRAP